MRGRRLVALALAGLALGGCDLFKPADPEPPAGNVIEANYTSPERSLVTMQQAIEAKSQNNALSAYIRAFADATQGDGRTASFTFDPAVLQTFPEPRRAPASNWTLDRESAFYAYFVTFRPEPLEVVWTTDVEHPDEEIAPDQRILHRRYRVFAVPTDESQPEILIAVGFADLTFVNISASRWAITKWEDRVDPSVGAQPEDSNQLTFSARRLESQ